MKLTRRAVVLTTCALAIAAFAFVQDRVTAAGARRYAASARAAIASRAQPPKIEEIMTPAIRSSVRWGGAAAAGVLAAGLGVAWTRRS